MDEWHIHVWLESYKVQNLGTAKTFQWRSNLHKSLLANSSDEPEWGDGLQACPSDQTTRNMVKWDRIHVQRQGISGSAEEANLRFRCIETRERLCLIVSDPSQATKTLRHDYRIIPRANWEACDESSIVIVTIPKTCIV